MEKGKIAVVCSGGGMRCAYSAGALVALATVHNLKNPDYIFAASGGAGGAIYYLAHQYEGIKEIWTRLVVTPKFISLLRPWRIMNIDYLIDTIFKQQQPLDTETIRSSLTRYFIPVTNAKTNEVRYISQEDNVDIFETLRATKAIPVAYGKQITIDGIPCIDGALHVCVHDMIRKAEEMGATRIIAIDCSLEKKKQDENVNEATTVIISNTHIPTWILDDNRKDLQKEFKLGYADMANNERVKQFLA